MVMSTAKSTRQNYPSLNNEKTGHNTPSFTVLGFSTAEPLAPERTSSCILCHHMHEKRPSKNIFLSFQAISLIPDELQGRGKHYGCELAGGKEGICRQCMSVRVSVYESLSEYIYITEKIYLITAFFYFVFLSMRVCVWQYVHACLSVDNWI